MAKENKVLLKINNLLRLSKNNKNLHESTAAILKAKELMQKHNLSELSLEEKSQNFNRKIVDSIRDKNQKLNKGTIEEWHACLANVLCNNNHCRCYLTSIQNGEMVEDAISVIGYENDVKFVFTLYDWLAIELVRLANENEILAAPLYKENFILGAIKKIGVRLQEEQLKINEQFRRTSKLEIGTKEGAIQLLDNRIKNIDSHLKNLNLKAQNKEIKNFVAFNKGYVKADCIDLLQNKKIT